MKIPVKVPILPLRNAVMYPFTTMYLLIGKEHTLKALKEAQSTDGLMAVVAQKEKNLGSDIVSFDTIHQMGTLCRIENVIGTEKSGFRVLARGISRFKINSLEKTEGFILALGENDPDIFDKEETEIRALTKSLKSMATEFLGLIPQDWSEVQSIIDRVKLPDELFYICASFTNISLEKKQKLLAEVNMSKKMEDLLTIIKKEKEILLLQNDIKGKIEQKQSLAQREAFLREQLNAIKDELGEGKDSEKAKILEKIEKANMPKEAKKKALTELDRLDHIHPSSPESQVVKGYLDWLTRLPWEFEQNVPVDIQKAKEVLDQNHYGLKKVKKKILQDLASRIKQPHTKGRILCLIGPPGVGKTSMGRSIAMALGKEFIRIALGGLRDEAEIRGHRRTYVGAMPGKIIHALEKTQSKNPVILFDEIDKLSYGFHGDPASALLEVLDPEQNHTFTDHFLDLPFDLSHVFFITTANIIDTIPGPLRDRMEFIEMHSYTPSEKIHIATNFIIPETIQDTDLGHPLLKLDNKLILSLIENYTRESGVRELKRVINSLYRAAIYEELVKKKPITKITQKTISTYIGPPKYNRDQYLSTQAPGVIMGLAWTPIGGTVLRLESAQMEGTGKLTLTGQLGEVMKESAIIALNFCRTQAYKYFPDIKFSKIDIHVHIPAGAIPKDGPSAGITILSSIVSLLTNREVATDIAMTGELTLAGNVLPVGGVKEKLMAGHRNGAKTILIPLANLRDLNEVPEEILKELKIITISNAHELLDILFGFSPIRPPYKEKNLKEQIL